MSRTLCATVILLLAAAPNAQVVIPGGKQAPKQVAPMSDGKVTLFGPFKLPRELREAAGTITLDLQQVTFDSKIGTSASLFLLEASETAIDPKAYIGSAGYVLGGTPGAVNVRQEINDFQTDAGEKFTARTKLKTMNEAYLAVVLLNGKGGLRFKRAVITAQPASP